jgi:hypothetical protein
VDLTTRDYVRYWRMEADVPLERFVAGEVELD